MESTIYDDWENRDQGFTPTKIEAIRASELVELERVSLSKIDCKGILSGVILCPDTQQEISCSLLIAGRDNFCPLGHNAPPAYYLALLLKYIKFCSLGKQKKVIKKITSEAPEWIKNRPIFSLKFDLTSNTLEADKYSQELIKFEMDCLQNFQIFWSLQDCAEKVEQKLHISKALIASHVLSIYPDSSWFILQSAMEAMVRRFLSADSEKLLISEYPIKPNVFGFYKVKFQRGDIRPYQIHLSGNNGLNGSCSCPDYQHNTLRWCKHLAAVMLHWHRGPRILKKFRGAQKQISPHLRWIPPVNVQGATDPLQGLQIVGLAPCRSKLLNQLRKYFSSDGLILLKRIDTLTKRSNFLSLLKKCCSYLKPRSILIDPAIPPLLETELDSLTWPRLFQKRKKPLLKGIDGLNLKLYPYQRIGTEKALAHGKFLLGDEMGLGKTVQGVAFAECLLQQKEAKRVLLICPAALKDQWKKEWENISGREIVIVEGTPENRDLIYGGSHKVLAINYELLLRDLDKIHQLKADLIILDEAQRFKNYQTETSKRVKTLKPKFRLILTGTPMENRIEELSSLVDWIKPAGLGPSWRLSSELKYYNPDNPNEKGVQNLKAIRERISPFFLRRTRSQVLKQLPARSDCPIYLPITDEQKDIHDGYAYKVKRLMAIGETRPLTPPEHIRLMAYLTKMRIVSNGIAQLDFETIWDDVRKESEPEKHFHSLFSPKLLEFRNLIRGLISQEGTKIVVFSQWQRMLRLCHWAIADLLIENDTEAVFFTGKENSKKRAVNIANFHEDPKVRIFFATDAGGVGINLQRAANICINLELPWNPAILEQRVGRIYRIGQKKPIQIFNLITKDSIEERISSLVGQKKAVFDALFDGESDQICFDKNTGFYQQVKEVVSDTVSKEIDIEEDQINIEDLTLLDSLPTEAAAPDLAEGKRAEVQENQVATASTHDNINKLSHSTNLSENIQSDTDSLGLFKDVKIEMKNGVFKVEARDETAKLMADAFMMLGRIFESSTID